MAIGEAQSHVVIEHSVHVFDPKSVDGPIEYSPLFVLALAAGTNTQDLGCEAVSPLVYLLYLNTDNNSNENI